MANNVGVSSSPTTALAIVRALGRALLAWIIILLLLAQVLALYKCQTEEAYLGGQDVTILPTAGYSESFSSSQQQQQVHNRLTRLLETLQETEREQQSLIASLEDQLSDLATSAAAIDDYKERVGHDDTETTLVSPITIALETLLTSTSRSSDLNELWLQARGELVTMKQHANTLDWVFLEVFFDAVVDMQAMMDKSEPNYSCTSAASSSTTHTPNMARESHLFQKLQQLERLLQDQLDSVADVNNNDKEDDGLDDDDLLVEWIEQETDDLLSASFFDPPTQNSHANDRVCIEPDQVLQMWEQSKTARSTDVRRVLEQLVRQYDTTLDSHAAVILDAPLPPVTEQDSSSEAGDSLFTNLRHVLDTELFHRSVVRAIDAALDVTSGYNDFLDQLVDQAVDKAKAQYGYESLGRVAVHHLLKEAGRVPLPHAEHMLRAKGVII